MFTGIVETVGRVVGLEDVASGRALSILAGFPEGTIRIGDSVAVNGVCLTAVGLDGGTVRLDVVGETLQRTNLGSLQVGDPVDLERPMAADGRFDGHIVQGHVDGVGRVLAMEAEGASRRVRIGIPDSLTRYVVEKGSVTVDGVSLTITAVSGAAETPAWFEVALIPHTLAVTVLGTIAPGDELNIEVDVIAKYLERLMEAHT